MHFTCRSFIGPPDSRNWCQYWENEPDDSTLSSQKGHLFGLISLTVDRNTPSLPATGRDLITEINQLYYQPASDNSVPRNLIRTIEIVSQNPLYQSYRFSFILAVILDNQLHLAVYRAGFCFLCRGNKISLLLSSGNGPVKSISGPLRSEDRLFLASDDFYRQFPLSDISHFLAETNLSLLEENIQAALHSCDSSSLLASAFIQIHEVVSLPDVVPTVLPHTRPKIRPSFSFIKKIFRSSPLYITSHDPIKLIRRRRLNSLISLVILIFITIGVYFGYLKKQKNRTERQYQQFKTDLETKITEANTLRNLNLDDAKLVAEKAKTVLDQMTNLKIHSKNLVPYQDQIHSLLSQTGALNAFSPDFFYDTSVIVDPPQFTRLFLRSPRLYLLDSKTGRIDTLDIKDKSIKNLAVNPAIQSSLGLIESKQIVYFYNRQGIFRLAPKGGLAPKSLDKLVDFTSAAKPVTPTDIKIWNDNFYILDSANSTIWKLSPNTSVINDKSVWLKSGQSLPGNPVALDINGQVWVLSLNGVITPYTRGVKNNYSQAQVNVSQANHLATGLDNEFLVFVDSGNIIYVFDKTGKSLAKYNLSSLSVSDLAFDGQTNSVYLLCTDQKIYKINI